MVAVQRPQRVLVQGVVAWVQRADNRDADYAYIGGRVTGEGSGKCVAVACSSKVKQAQTTNAAQVLTPADTLTGCEVLPDFMQALYNIFKQENDEQRG